MLKPFLDDCFLLDTPTAQRLYYEYAAGMPIIDYHNHLHPGQIAHNYQFANITEAWLSVDHYKWRAMRANGIAEQFITGNSSDEDKFLHWATTVPHTLRNPLFHWTHLELQRYFGITTLLNQDTATQLYQQCNHLLQQDDYRVHGLLKKMNVQLLCTTDDPVDTLENHLWIQQQQVPVKVLPAFRPDKAIDVSDATAFNKYLGLLEAAAGIAITTFDQYVAALQQRHHYFAQAGCIISDHGLEYLPVADFTEAEIQAYFLRLRMGKQLSFTEQQQFKSCMLLLLAEWNYEKNWVQQFHLGPLRNNNSRLQKLLGADAGTDSMGDFLHAHPLSVFLNKLDSKGKLAKTILYNSNPSDNEVFATMAGNFNDGSMPGKIQWGSAWWFLDQKDGIEKQLNTLSNTGLISRFIGMLTDSRSFLSFPRHEYFRRILCNVLGAEMEKGLLPNDIKWIGNMVKDICYNNTKNYLNC
jgi:glucuronate isomerase